MNLARVLGGVGRFLIGAGVIILLFVAYQLWGTNLQHAQAQNALEDEFDELLASAAAPATLETPKSPKGSTTTVPEAVPIGGSATEQRWTPETLAFAFPEGGDAVARIEMPTIGVNEVIVEGVQVADLRKGPGHYRATVMPGQPGNAAIAGHRTTYGAPFQDIDRLAVDDDIVVTTVQGSFTYRVVNAGTAYPDREQTLLDAARPHAIVSPEDTWVLGEYGDDRLTLTACHPKFSARQRIIVAAVLVDEPGAARPVVDRSGGAVSLTDADTGETIELADEALPIDLTSAEDYGDEVSLDEGLAWDTSPLPKALLYGLIAALIFLAAWFAARRWRRIPSYAVALVPFAFALYLAFEQVDRILPAY